MFSDSAEATVSVGREGECIQWVETEEEVAGESTSRTNVLQGLESPGQASELTRGMWIINLKQEVKLGFQTLPD